MIQTRIPGRTKEKLFMEFHIDGSVFDADLEHTRTYYQSKQQKKKKNQKKKRKLILIADIIEI